MHDSGNSAQGAEVVSNRREQDLDAEALRANRIRRLQIVEAVDRLLSDSLDRDMSGKIAIEIDVRKGRIGRGRKSISYDRL